MQINEQQRNRISRSAALREALARADATAIEELGLSLTDGTRIELVQDSAVLVHLVIPRDTTAPASDDPADRIITRAMTDEAYRARLLADPAATVSDAFGLPLPDDVRIVVMQDTPEVVHIVLPPAQAMAGSQPFAAAPINTGSAWGCKDGPTTQAGNSLCTSQDFNCTHVVNGGPECQPDEPDDPIDPGDPGDPGDPDPPDTDPSDPFF